jgi:hypothetical protein
MQSDQNAELSPRRLTANWSDDSLFFTHVWRDETSMFDDHPSVRWEGGGEYYSREFKCRVPKAFENCDELIDMFIEWMTDNATETKGFWVN